MNINTGVSGAASAPPVDWPPDSAVVDGFPARLGIEEIVSLLGSVGFNSPPSWLRPFSALSNGEQFRAQMAMLLASAKSGAPVVVDEFTSVIDRQAARIGSAAADLVAAILAATGKPYRLTTGHKGYARQRAASPHWRLSRAGGVNGRNSGKRFANSAYVPRLTWSFLYVGPVNREAAQGFEIVQTGKR